jgi:hypothetical protein
MADDVVAAAGQDVAKGIAGTSQMANASQPGMFDRLGSFYSSLSTPEQIGLGIAGGVGLNALTGQRPTVPKLDDSYDGPLSRFNYDPDKFSPTRVTPNVYRPSYAAEGGVMKSYAQGGIAALANGGIGNNSGYPMGQMDMTQYATPTQMPTSAQIVNSDYAQKTDPYLGTPIGMAEGGIAGYNLGGYASGGNPRLLKGPGDGMSDNIPATIGDRQPARLADGEFVVPADVVSHLGNGSTDAGAKHLYRMMDKVRKARTGKKRQGKQIKPEKFLPA